MPNFYPSETTESAVVAAQDTMMDRLRHCEEQIKHLQGRVHELELALDRVLEWRSDKERF